jgi:hypothetical protein
VSHAPHHREETPLLEALIGVNGYGGAGKDTLADLLVTHFGFTKIAFADPMRDMAVAIDPIVGYIPGPDGDGEFIRYTDALEFHGYDEAKVMYPETRQFLQRLGTDGGRVILGDDVWVRPAMERAQAHRRVVFSDMRFKNEAEAVKAAGGRTIRVTRPGVGPANDHISEVDLDEWAFDLFVNNNGPINQMIGRLEHFFARHYTKILRTT